jgi:hypothetical protein
VSYHIEDVLKSVAEAPPPPHTTTDDIITRARRRRTGRSVAMSGALVACVAVAVTVLPRLGPAGTDGTMPAAQPTAPMASFSAPPAAPTGAPLPVKRIDFRTNLGEYRVGAFQIGPATTVTEGYTELPVYHDGSTWENELGEKFPLTVATITVYREDVYDPSTFGGAGDTSLTIGDQYPVTVGGRDAIGRDWTYGSPVDAAKKQTVAALAWQWADNSWATFLPSYGGPGMSRDQVATIAARLTTTAERDLKVPYRLGYLPKGWQAVSVQQIEAKYGMSESVVFLHQGALTDPATRVDAVLPGHLVIGVMQKPKPGEKNEHSTKPGVQCAPDQQTCSVVHGDYLVTFGGYGNVLSESQIRRIAGELDLRNPADPSSWVKVDF